MGGNNKCPVCSATFTRSQHVARHMRSHTGDRPYPCPWCPEKFARSDLLARHKKKFHPDGPNSAPPPPKYSRQPKPAAVASAGAVAGPSGGKGKARADSTADGVAQLSLSDHPSYTIEDGGVANSLRRGSYAGLTSAGPFGAGGYTFGSLPAFEGALGGAEPFVVSGGDGPHPPQPALQGGHSYPHPVGDYPVYGQLQPPPPQQQQQHVPQPSYQAYDRRFSLPGGLTYSSYAQQLQPQQHASYQVQPQQQQQQQVYLARQSYAHQPQQQQQQQQQQQTYGQPSVAATSSSLYGLAPSGASSRGSSASSSEYGTGQRLGPPVSVTPYASSSSSTGPAALGPPPVITTSSVGGGGLGGGGLTDSPVGVSPADSASTFGSSVRSGSQHTSPLPPQQQQQPPQGWFQPVGSSFAPPQQQRQPPPPPQGGAYYTSPLASGVDALGNATSAHQQQQFTLDSAAYVSHLMVGGNEGDSSSPADGQDGTHPPAASTAGALSQPVDGEAGSRSPLALAGWSGLDWTTAAFNPDSPAPSPGPFGAGRAVKPSLNPLQASAHLGLMEPQQPQGHAHHLGHLGQHQYQQPQQPQKIPSLEDVKDIWRYFLSPALPTPAAQPFGGLAPPLDGAGASTNNQASDSAVVGDADGQAIPSPPALLQQEQQKQQQQPFATDEAQARSFEDAIRSRPTMQLQPPGPMRPARSTASSSPAAGTGYGHQPQQPHLQQGYVQPPPGQQHLQPQPPPHVPYYSTWPPPTLAPAEARGLLSSTLAAGGAVSGVGGKREFSSIDLGTPRSGGGAAGGGYASYFSPPNGGAGAGGRPKMARLRSGSVGRVPEGEVWEGFLEGYRGAAMGFGGGEGVFPSA